MKWTRGHESQFVDDRRGRSKGAIAGLGIVGTIIAVLVSNFLGVDIRPLLGGGGAGGEPIPADQDRDRELKEMVSFVLDEAQAMWARELPRQAGIEYRPARMVLFTEAVQTRCGAADSGVGPFYCGGDEQVYIDLSFYRLLDERFGAPGDFAQAYVIAHEIGHHVQHITGVFAKARAAGRDDNATSIRQELQADCYAGIWAKATAKKDLLEAGDLEEGLAAAAAVGDDSLQKKASGHVEPERWTHGSAAMRTKWFRIGFDTGDMKACDTFAVASP